MNIHLMGIGGTGMGALAGLLKQLGHNVRGSDKQLYPPMSHKLPQWGIEVLHGFKAENLDPTPDLVIVGNVIRRDNPEAVALERTNIPRLSMPQALGKFAIGQKQSLVITGTHGKTTISSLVAHLAMVCGLDPSFWVGGAMKNYPENFRSGQGNVCVLEGDEYDTAYFDKGPKFWHYRPFSACITSLEFDHADIFADMAAIEQAFAGFIRLMPKDGQLCIWQGAERALRLAREQAPCQVLTYDASQPAPDTAVALSMAQHHTSADGLTFVAQVHGKPLSERPMHTQLWGAHSANNVLAALGVLLPFNLPPEKLREGFASYQGVQRRLEVRCEAQGITLVDDFAHHPTAVAATLQAAALRWPQRRLVAAFEPRSATTRRNTLQPAYIQAFGLAKVVALGSHPRLHEIPEAQRFAPLQLAADLQALGIDAFYAEAVPDLQTQLLARLLPGDVVLIMSNGDFDGLLLQLESALNGGWHAGTV